MKRYYNAEAVAMAEVVGEEGALLDVVLDSVSKNMNLQLIVLMRVGRKEVSHVQSLKASPDPAHHFSDHW